VPPLLTRPARYRSPCRRYAPEAYALSSFLIELPWLLFICLTVIPIVYFMVGFNSSAAAFFF
jgi:ABC-type multidrug transport system permease subunit